MTTSEAMPPRRWVLPVLVLQLALCTLYAAFWLDPRPTGDTTLDFAVFLASPFVFAVALVLGLLGQWRRRSGVPVLAASMTGNLLMLLCLIASVGWLTLLALLEVLFTLD